VGGGGRGGGRRRVAQGELRGRGGKNGGEGGREVIKKGEE
jgi:hypothetical protein